MLMETMKSTSMRLKIGLRSTSQTMTKKISLMASLRPMRMVRKLSIAPRPWMT